VRREFRRIQAVRVVALPLACSIVPESVPIRLLSLPVATRKIALVHDIVPVEHGSGLVAGQLHGRFLWHGRPARDYAPRCA
jgi:hypothetical protein